MRTAPLSWSSPSPWPETRGRGVGMEDQPCQPLPSSLIPAHTLALSPLSFLSSFLLAAAARHRHRRVVETCNASRCLPSACLPACWARTTDAREAGGRTTAEARAGRDWRTRGRERRRERLSEARKSDECSIRGGGVKDEHGQQPVGDGVD